MAAIARAVGALFFVDMAHIAGLVAGGMHPSPVPDADFVSTTTHKTLRGPRGGLVLCKTQYAKELDRITFPGTQGGPLMHIIAAKAVCLKERPIRDSANTRSKSSPTRANWPAEISKAGFRIVTGHGQPSLPDRSVFARSHGQGRAAGARPRGHHGQQKFDPVRSHTADDGGRNSPGHSRRNDARDARGGHGTHRRVDRRALSHLGDAERERRIRAEVAEFATQFSALQPPLEFTPSLAGSPGASR